MHDDDPPEKNVADMLRIHTLRGTDAADESLMAHRSPAAPLYFFNFTREARLPCTPITVLDWQRNRKPVA